MGKTDEGKKLKDLRQELVDLDAKRVEFEAQKKAVGAERARLKAKLEADYKDSINMFKMGELIEGGGNLTDKALKSKTFDSNENLKKGVARIEGAFLAVGEHLNELATKRKALAREIEVLENKSLIENLKQAHAGLVAAIVATEKSYGEYHRLLSEAPSNCVDIARRAGIKDEFFLAGISKTTKPGENLFTWIGWASKLVLAGNPFYGHRRESGPSQFKRGGLYHGHNDHFQNS